MTDPDKFEELAMNAALEGDTEKAKVIAILALASAVNRLAGVQTPPSSSSPFHWA